MAKVPPPASEGNLFLVLSAIFCLFSLCLMLICWAIFGESITRFYRIHVSENFGSDDKKQ
ncbi:putative integral membrane protein [Babesia bovis T2Bo]|uniref:putative integral membrane protein n=1 Tax=Babesia bovis T2Bo TaxID=484906 RepID=UPI001C35A73A|nr:putative integral membrane protein [Babesia bovis T2Bo]KAG6440090.1 putative integral membrane protein [Babesia bovis T2Bo]